MKIEIKQEEFDIFILFFKFTIVKYRNIWLTINSQFKQQIKEHFQEDNNYVRF